MEEIILGPFNSVVFGTRGKIVARGPKGTASFVPERVRAIMTDDSGNYYIVYATNKKSYFARYAPEKAPDLAKLSPIEALKNDKGEVVWSADKNEQKEAAALATAPEPAPALIAPPGDFVVALSDFGFTPIPYIRDVIDGVEAEATVGDTKVAYRILFGTATGDHPAILVEYRDRPIAFFTVADGVVNADEAKAKFADLLAALKQAGYTIRPLASKQRRYKRPSRERREAPSRRSETRARDRGISKNRKARKRDAKSDERQMPAPGDTQLPEWADAELHYQGKVYPAKKSRIGGWYAKKSWKEIGKSGFKYPQIFEGGQRISVEVEESGDYLNVRPRKTASDRRRRWRSAPA